MVSSGTDVGCVSSTNTWAYSSCPLATVVEGVLKLAVLIFALLPRIVFIKTEEQVEKTWSDQLKSVGKDYQRGLTLTNPKTFSDDE